MVGESDFKRFKEKRFEEDLKKALILVRDLRAEALHLDARAVRVALKFALMIDDYLAKERITQEEDEQLTRIAENLFKQTPKRTL
jgi:hypothetical protein